MLGRWGEGSKDIARTLSYVGKGWEGVRGVRERKFVYDFLVGKAVEDMRHIVRLVVFLPFGFVPDFVHLREGHFGELSPLFERFGFEVVKATDEFLVSAL